MARIKKELGFSWLIVLIVALLISLSLYDLSPGFSANTKTLLEKGQTKDIPPTSMWLELGVDGVPIARLITRASSCPVIVTDGQSHPMEIRLRPTDEFPVLVCEYKIPIAIKSIQINGKSLPLLKPNPQKIAVIGDTGCRLKGKSIQNCNDPKQWPFKEIAETVANWKPDLIIHVGDYLYRETPCPKNDSGCAASAYGDFWQAWQDDFFSPSDKLLPVAPWIVARGNHELCNRGGRGWFYLLDPRSLSAQCQNYTEPYSVSLGDFDIVVMDSALANDLKAIPEQVEVYAKQFKQIESMTTGPSWLLVHRPIWGMGQTIQQGQPKVYTANYTLQAASENHLPPLISFVLSGHIHMFEILGFEDKRPIQSITGNSGTALDASLSVPIKGIEIAQTKSVGGTSIGKFGFMTLERKGHNSKHWIAKARGVDGLPQATCEIENLQVICKT